MKRLCAFLCKLMLIMLSSSVAGAPGDFVRGRVITADSTQIVQRATIPQDVYEWVSRADLGDLRVFNGEHAEVPYTLRRPTSQQEFSEWIDLPMFVLPDRDVGTGAGASVSVQVDGGGAVVSVSGGLTESAESARPAGWLVDTSGFQGAIAELTVQWTSSLQGFIGKFQVEASNDLNSWRIIAGSTTLARLETNGLQVVVDRIKLPEVRARYLKIVQLDGRDDLEISSMRARSRQAQLPQRQWKLLTGTFSEGGYEFMTGGLFPLDRVAVELEQDTFLVDARVFSKSREKDEWRLRGQSMFYRVAVNDTTASSEPLTTSSRDRYWRVELVAGNTQSPSLKIGWLPDEVVFLKQGSSPYLLAYGQAGVVGSHWPMQDLLSRLGTGVDIDSIKPAQLSAANTLGGPGRLEPAPEPVDWRTISLWSVLVIGVGVIGLFAYRLLRAPAAI